MQIQVFVDESGTTGLNIGEGESPLYICVAVVVDNEKIHILLEEMEQIAKTLRQGATIKHSNIGKDFDARTKILNAVCALDFTYYALIVNKRALNEYPGLKFKGSFYKYMLRKLHTLVGKNTTGDTLVINTDTYGKEEFQASCKTYFSKHLESLFEEVVLEFKNDKDHRLIQVADLIAGTLNYCFFRYRDTPQALGWRASLQKKEVGIDPFPLPYFGENALIAPFENEIHNKIWSFLLKNAQDFIVEKTESADLFEQMQSVVLRRLLVDRRCEENDGYIYSDKLMEWLTKEYDFEVNKQQFTSKIIGGLRESGIVISGSTKGYKLALSIEDINEYLDHDKAVILPMLYRLKVAKRKVLGTTQHDILNNESYKTLNALLIAHEDSEIKHSVYIDDEQTVSLTED